ncbi:MAG TPA: DoxX family protein [Candidatus Sulfotelmatobacter sp.]|nr:DoxX family protein [Candidatus Sulfotelmatobacter sp.]
MHSTAQAVSISRAALWTGRVMSALPVLLILFGSIMKLIRHPSVIDGFARAGLPPRLIIPVGLIELVCVVVYVVPRTSVLGAILMTGLLGGATLTTLRVGDPTFPMPVILGMLAWGGLYLRDRRLRQLIPLREPPQSV